MQVRGKTLGLVPQAARWPGCREGVVRRRPLCGWGRCGRGHLRPGHPPPVPPPMPRARWRPCWPAAAPGEGGPARSTSITAPLAPIWTHTHTHTHTHAFTLNTYSPTYKHTFTPAPTHTHTHIQAHSHTHPLTHAQRPTPTHTPTLTHPHAHFTHINPHSTAPRGPCPHPSLAAISRKRTGGFISGKAHRSPHQDETLIWFLGEKALFNDWVIHLPPPSAAAASTHHTHHTFRWLLSFYVLGKQCNLHSNLDSQKLHFRDSFIPPTYCWDLCNSSFLISLIFYMH